MSKSMTPERAIKSIQEHNRIHFEKEKGKCPIITEALQMAISALEKQIPKKPIFDEETGAYYCPNCKRVQAYTVNGFRDYCELCGQAIDKSLDWSDEE